MRILDLGCGKATSSIFLAREFGVEAWAADGATSPSENRKRAVGLGCEGNVFPFGWMRMICRSRKTSSMR